VIFIVERPILYLLNRTAAGSGSGAARRSRPDATRGPPKIAAVTVGRYVQNGSGVVFCINDVPSQMLRDLAAALPAAGQ
jgi:hypothetical protein